MFATEIRKKADLSQSPAGGYSSAILQWEVELFEAGGLRFVSPSRKRPTEPKPRSYPTLK